MRKLDQAEPENVCRELASTFATVLSWKWDDHFKTVLSEFNTDHKELIHSGLACRLDSIWDSAVIEKAPEAVHTINRNFGGIMPGQLLFTSDPNQDIFVFCAWWPWGNGKTISIRLAPFYKCPSDSDRAGQTRQLKGWFGI